MPVDPQVQVLLDQMAAMNAPGLGTMTVERTQTMMEQFATMGGPGPEVAAVEDRTIPSATGGELPIRIYRPSDAGGKPQPALVWYHGGGFVIGNITGSDMTCRELATKSGA